ncbi:unnamed protein product [Brassicogethes aeneus]|uniref:TIR domain-containing protein n=1 Tax=Brassicogethes aeneus TaxID=1431903 RepID=A0A9P0BKC1_BRAAE|nr:unnamed protein product [Brassicogethes aeneus]
MISSLEHYCPNMNHDPYKVCVHYRDWIPGVLITEQVITSVRDSRRTLVIVSKNFLESCWTKWNSEPLTRRPLPKEEAES